MSKNIFYDIIPPNKRSIRNVTFESARGENIKPTQLKDIVETIPEPTKINIPINAIKTEEFKKQPIVQEIAREKVVPKISALEDWKIHQNNSVVQTSTASIINQPKITLKKPSEGRVRSQHFSGFRIWSVAITAFAVLFFAISTFFSHAIVHITVKTQTLNSEIKLQTQKTDDTEKTLTYTEMSLAKDYSMAIQAKGSQKEETKASGNISISNNTNVAQKLIKDTRFESIDGLIFRLKETATVPAASQNGGFKEAGKITAVIVADKAGAAYNIDKGLLTVPAFKNDPRYVAINGTVTTALTGGEIKTIPILSTTDKASVTSNIQEQIKKGLLQDVAAQIPKGFVTFHETDEYTFDPIQYSLSGNNATATIKGFIKSIIFPEENLKRQLAIELLRTGTSTTQKVDGAVDDISKLVISGFNFSDPNKGTVSFKGQLTVRGIINEDVLKKDLRGVSRGDVEQVFSQYASISKAEVQFIPFWSFHMPKNTSSIKVDIQK